MFATACFLAATCSSMIPRALAASEIYASPDGSGRHCSVSMPCGLSDALEKASEGDYVKLMGGEYTENLILTTPHLTLGAADTDHMPTIKATNEANEMNQNVPIIVSGPGITLEYLNVVLGPLEEDLDQRDMGVFVNPMGSGATLKGLNIHRDETRMGFEPSEGPGTRGVLVFAADDVIIEDCKVTGPFQDGIHLPSVNTVVANCEVYDSTRVGVVVIQETPESDNSGHVIMNTLVKNFGVDGIQIQGDDTIVEDCTVSTDTEAIYGIHVCAFGLVDDSGMEAVCVPPVSMPGREDVAEAVTLQNNRVDPANLKQAVVAPKETTIINDDKDGADKDGKDAGSHKDAPSHKRDDDMGMYGDEGAYGNEM